MKKLLMVLFVLSSFTTYSQDTIKVHEVYDSKGSVRSVKMLSSKRNSRGDITITFQLEAIASACEIFTELKAFGGQTSLSDGLNPTDKYYKIGTTWRPGCATGSYGEVKTFNFKLGYNPGRSFGIIHHLSFDIGMLGGFNRYALYKLDLSNAKSPRFDFVKNYSYVEGDVVNH